MNRNRRTFLTGAMAALAASTASKSPLAAKAQELAGTSSLGIPPRTKRCLLLWMDGGPSQFETFDPKPGTATGGPTEGTATATPGVHFASGLSKLAAHSEDLCVIRTVTSNQGEHERARFLGHTGFERVPAFERPEIGALVSHRCPSEDLPGFVTLGSPGYGAAYLGPQHAPLVIEDPARSADLMRKLRRRSNRFEMLESFNQDFEPSRVSSQSDHGNAGIAGLTRQRVRRRADELARLRRYLQSPLPDLLHPKDESSATGGDAFDQRLRVATGLLNAGVSCVEVSMPGWDTHRDNFGQTETLTSRLDAAMASAIDRLRVDGLWEETLLIWAGDFGRTPTINAASGRDHFPRISNVVLSGGGIPGGIVIGETDPTGREIQDRPITIPDLFATILGRFGIDADESYETAFGSPTEATDGGRPIEELSLRATS